MIKKLLNLFKAKNEKIYPHGFWTFEVREGERLVQRVEKKNLVPSVGLNTFAAQLGSPSITKDIGDNLFIALGDDNTAPTSGDTILNNETVRKAISDRNSSSAVASIYVFFASGEATGTHEEVGLFGDGNTTTASSSSDSGIMYSHALLPVSVSASQTLTVSYTFTMSTS